MVPSPGSTSTFATSCPEVLNSAETIRVFDLGKVSSANKSQTVQRQLHVMDVGSRFRTLQTCQNSLCERSHSLLDQEKYPLPAYNWEKQ